MTVLPPRFTKLSAFLAAVAFMAIGALGREVHAHPHIWIEAEIVVPLTDGMVRAIEVHWRFDEAFGAVAIGDFDTDGNGRLDPDEAARLGANSLRSLRDFGYFTHVALDGEDVATDRLERLDVREAEGTLLYTLVVPLPRPVDPTRTALSVALYDPSYYTDVALSEVDPVRLVGGWPPGCRPEASEDPRHAIYFGMVYPIRVHFRCAPLSDGRPDRTPGADTARVPAAGSG